MKLIISFEPKKKQNQIDKNKTKKRNFTGKYNLNSGGNSSSE
jgi:hypothetical protein